MAGLILLVLAASTSQVDACEAAVRTNLASAAQVCVVPKESIDLLAAYGLSAACERAMNAGRQAGKNGPHVPDVMRRGLIADFEKKLAACRNPAPAPEVQTRETVNLWD